MLTKTLIVGDSFAAPITGADHAWYNNIGPVKNCAQAGIGQYKILKQIQNYYNTQTNVILVITSENRIHIEKNPFYSIGHYHENCDLIFSDVSSRKSIRKKDQETLQQAMEGLKVDSTMESSNLVKATSSSTSSTSTKPATNSVNDEEIKKGDN